MSGAASYALAYAERGWPVFPVHSIRQGGCTCADPSCSKPGKHPRTTNGLLDATTDVESITQKWEKWPDSNSGVRMGAEAGVFAIDVDPRHSGDKTLADLEAIHGKLPPTFTVTTGGEGQHIILKHPGFKVISKTYFKGVDIKGDGGYIVGAGSLHISGRCYTILNDVPVSDAPHWLLDILRRESEGQQRGKSEQTNSDGGGDTIPEGQRNSTLTSLAGTLRRRNSSDEAILAALLAENQSRCSPPLPESEIREIVKSISRYESSQDDKGKSENLTDLGNARRFVTQHNSDIRHVPSWGWLCWDGKVWEHDNTGAIQRKAKTTVMTIYAEVMRAEDPDVRKAISKHATKSESEASIDHMTELAKTESEVIATTHDFDRDPFLFNVQNGTIDLRTGQLREHSSADHITKMAPVTFDPDAQCPLWEKFLHTIMDGNKTLIRYQQKSIGYALTGSTKEQKVFVHNGGGGNGKSVFINTIRNYMGPYALQAQAETFMTKNNPGIPNDLARLVGARLVTVQETEAGKRLAESLVKAVSGGDTITARFLHKEYFEFIPSFKLFLITNHRPIIRGQDYAIWRRVDLIPYSVTIPLSEQDRELEDKLKKELSGILNWTIEGCLAWQREGLGLPEEVQSATSDYRAEQADTVYHFIIDTCKQDINGRISAKVFHEAYQTWCNDNSEDPAEQRTFKRKVQDLGFKQKKTGKNGSREWHGLRFTDGTDGVTLKTPFFLYNSSYEKNIENDVTPSVPSVDGMEPPILDGEA